MNIEPKVVANVMRIQRSIEILKKNMRLICSTGQKEKKPKIYGITPSDSLNPSWDSSSFMSLSDKSCIPFKDIPCFSVQSYQDKRAR